jgi:hypothetical protein
MPLFPMVVLLRRTSFHFLEGLLFMGQRNMVPSDLLVDVGDFVPAVVVSSSETL